jgi:RHS repeat-associated protein
MISKWHTALLKALHSRRLAAILITMSMTGMVASMSVPPADPLSAPSSTAQSPLLAPHPATAGGQSATQMPDGRWLLVGGTEQPGALQIFDSVAEQTEDLPLQLSEPRSGQTASVLPDGSVLIFGGVGIDGNVLSTAERYDPAASTLTPLGDIGLEARAYHTATVLTDGRLLLLGGEGVQRQLLPDAQIFDPATHVVTRLDAPLPIPEIGAAATLLSNGAVLLWGGTDLTQKAVAFGALFKPADNSLVPVGAEEAEALVSTLLTGDVPGIAFSQPASGVSDASVSAPLTVRFSSRMNVATLNDRSVTLIGPHGVTDVALTPTDDGLLLFITPKQDLVPGSDYTLFLNGTQDASGKALPFVAQGFVTTTLNPNAASSNAASALALSTSATKSAAGTNAADAVSSTPVASGTSGNSGGAPHASVSSPTQATTSTLTAPLARIARGAAAALQVPTAKPTAAQPPTSPSVAAVGDRWVPSQSNYDRGDWRSRNRGLAAQNKPQNDLLRRALYGNPEILAIMKQVTPATVATGLLKNLVAPEHITGPSGITAVTGQVLRLNGQPLGNVTLSIGARSVETNSNGEFTLANIPSGHQVLIIDGATANQGGQQYGQYEYGVNVVAGQTLALPFIIWMTALDTEHAETISAPTSAPTVLTDPEIPGLELRIPAGMVIRDTNGKIVTHVSITAIPTDQPPFPLPNVPVPTFFTIQPGGAHLEATGGQVNRGAQLIYPNFQHLPAGTRMNFWNYDPSGKGWYVYGQGKVTQDRTQVLPDPGVAIYEFTGAMVSSPTFEPTTGPTPGGPCPGDPVDCATGLFVYDQVDLAVSDVIPIKIRRTYRPGDSVSRAFGIGTNLGYDLFNVGTSDITASSDYTYTYQDLVLPDGSHIHYPRISQGTSWTDAVYQNTTTPGRFYGSIIYYSFVPALDTAWWLVLRDGTVIGFPASDSATYAREAAAHIIMDRNGNTVTLTRDAYANLTQITSPNGRHLNLTYDSSNRVTQASDDIGRTTTYAYDSSGRLIQATDPEGRIESYTYDSNNDMLTVTDRRGHVWLTNTYDSSGRVLTQTYADGTSSSFAYTLDGTGTYIAQTNFTDQRGTVTQSLLNANGYVTQMTRGLGLSIQQQTTLSRNSTTNLLNSTTDALGRTTNYSYDSLGNVTQVTRLAGTANAVSASAQYNTVFSEPASITDPNGNEIQFSYDVHGNLTKATDALGHSVLASYDGEGRPISLTDANGNTSSLLYSGANLVSLTDALGRKISRGVDGIGRTVSITNALGAQSTVDYDPLNEITSSTDPNGGELQFTYDANGDKLTQTDANSHTRSYIYDPRNRVISMTDALSNVANYAYEPGGRISQYIDRKGQVSGSTYDGLGRVTQIGFGATTSSPTAYMGTVVPTWDAGNRVTQIVDSVSGTITRTYDGLNRLTQETTPQGTVSYTYDAAGRRTSMSVQAQPTITYTWNAANRLTQIQQAAGLLNGYVAQTITFQYDNAGRRTQMVLSNGLAISYGYDSANELTSINYATSSGIALGNLTYGYDASGARTSVGGSLASVVIPSLAVTSTYDANNRLTQLNGASLSYDANGNTTNDGTNSYTWDARNRLTSLSGPVNGSFQYDAMGRRTQKTIGGATTGFLYDGQNYVQEQNASGSATATLITGGTDQLLARETSAGVSVPMADALGSVIAETNPAQTITTSYSYDPYGATTHAGATTGNAQQYTGRENDGTGLYYYRARYYSPQTARFISEDPIGWRSGQANNYAYAGGNPVSLTDPSGLCGSQSSGPWKGGGGSSSGGGGGHTTGPGSGGNNGSGGGGASRPGAGAGCSGCLVAPPDLIADDQPIDPLNWFWADLLTLGTASEPQVVDLFDQAFQWLTDMAPTMTINTLAELAWAAAPDLIYSEGLEGEEVLEEWVYQLEEAEWDAIADGNAGFVDLPTFPTLIVYPPLITVIVIVIL